jgi:AraC family transcriptional regulator, regulatory protein of adaptative response / DNA-3-methyladenine glycosylase II
VKNWDAVEVTLKVDGPFARQPLLAYLAARAMPGVEVVNERRYRRVICTNGQPSVLSVDFSRDAEGIVLAACGPGTPVNSTELCEMVAGLIDCDAPVGEIAAHLSRDSALDSLVRQHPGLRIPGTVSPFELAVRAILGQQVSVSAARTLSGRVAAIWGTALAAKTAAELSHSFPEPRDLRDARLEEVGTSPLRADAVRALAEAVEEGRIRLKRESRHFREVESALLEIKGIGPWTTAYIMIRALGDGNAIPTADLGLRQALAPRDEVLTPRELARRAEPWRPWRAYAAVHLWTTFLG